MAANRRIAKEWADLQADPVENVSVAPDESNMLKCGAAASVCSS